MRYAGSVDVVTLDDEPARQAAREDPRAFARRPVDTLVIDEAQLEHPDGRGGGLEIKATSTPRSGDFRGLRLLAERLGDRFVFGAVLSMAPEATPFGDRLAALPLDVLWRDLR